MRRELGTGPMWVVLVAAAVAAALLLGLTADADAAPNPDAARTPGIASHYGPPSEASGPISCGRGVVRAGEHGAASTTIPCGTRVGVCLPDLSRCVQFRIRDYGPDPRLGRALDLWGATFSAIAPLSAGLVRVVYRVQNVPRCQPRSDKTYWRPSQGLGGRYAPTCGTRAAR